MLNEHTGTDPQKLGIIDDLSNMESPFEDDLHDDVDSESDVKAFEPAPLKSEGRKPRKRKSKSKKKVDPLADWARLCQNAPEESILKYNISRGYEQFDLVQHPSFGVGYVFEVCSKTKIAVAFQDQVKRLVCNLPED